jgi:hypothetical protein
MHYGILNKLQAALGLYSTQRMVACTVQRGALFLLLLSPS